jgi:C1A family cysteine protease
MRGCGFIEDPSDIVDAELYARNARGLIGNTTSVPESFTWAVTGAVPRARDQASTSSCVGQALAASIEIRSAIQGHRVVPSAKAIYDLARMMDARGRPLVDAGSQPSRAIEGVKEYGLVSESRWPFSVADIDVPPPLDVFHHGCDAMLGQHYRITPGRGAAQAIREALVKGYIPIFAMTVDDAYDRYDGSDVYRAPSGRALGRHMQAIVGYYGETFEVLNSWGPAWGRDGIARVASGIIESSDVSSILVPTIVPLSVS